MKICIAAPIATSDVAAYLDSVPASAPCGYVGAPLTGVLIGELLRRGHEIIGVTVDYAMPAGARSVRLRGERFDFRVLPGRRRAFRFNGLSPGRAVDLWRVERGLIAGAITASRPDLVHAHWTYEFALGALDSGVPHLITCHDAPGVIVRYTRSLYRALRYLMAKEVLRRAEHVTAVSSYMADAARRLGAKQVVVVPNPLADYVLTKGRARARPLSRRIALICNGMQRLKNIEAGIEAFARFRRDVDNAELHLFGLDMGAGQRAHRWAESQGITAGLRFRGPMTHSDLMDALATMDVLLHPALEESFGVVVAEAMALGLPVVAGANSGAVPSVVGPGDPRRDCAAGVLTDVTRPEAMCAALAEAFDDRFAARSELGRARALEQFAAQEIVDRYSTIYRSILRPTADALSERAVLAER